MRTGRKDCVIGWDKMMKTKTRDNFRLFLCGAVMFAASFLLLFLARQRKDFSEWYATHLYRGLSALFGSVSGVFPFSVVEMLLYLLIILFIVSAVRFVIAWHRRSDAKEKLIRFLVNSWVLFSVLFLLYALNCGINYQRKTFSELEEIAIVPYSAEELEEVCRMLTEDVNTYADAVERNEQGVMCLRGDERALAAEAMERLGETYPEFEGEYPLPKPLVGSWILSVQSLTGVYSPFTVEANYNQDMTDYNIPFTMCHELSHLRGFMEEKEANFIAYLACIESDQDEFRYSGSLLGWIYCTNLLRKLDTEAWEEVRAELSEKAYADLVANSAFWAFYDGKVAQVSERVNDRYLKANGQEEGVEGYDRMVDLMVTYLLVEKNEK